MKSYRSGSKSGLFLMELIIAIVFFALASAICIRFFVRAHLNSTRSGDLGAAISIAQNAAEAYKAGSAEFSYAPSGDGATTYHQIYYDGDGRKLDSPEGAAYRLVYSFEPDGGLHSMKVSVFKLSDVPEEYGDPLCSLTAARYDG